MSSPLVSVTSEERTATGVAKDMTNRDHQEAHENRRNAFTQIQRIKRRLTDLGGSSYRAQKKYIAEGVANDLLILNISSREDEEDYSQETETTTQHPDSPMSTARRKPFNNPFLVGHSSSSSTSRYRSRRTSGSRSSSDERSSSDQSSDGGRKTSDDELTCLHIPQEVRDYLSRPPDSYLLPKAPDNSKALIIYTPPEAVTSSVVGSVELLRTWALSSPVSPTATQSSPSTPSPIEQEEVEELVVLESNKPALLPRPVAAPPREMEFDQITSMTIQDTEVEEMHF